MCKKLICLLCFVVLVGVIVSPSGAEIVGWWKFDEGSGSTANDSSGRGHTGNIQGTTSWVEGFVGDYAINLTGGYVMVNDSSDLRPPQFTVTAWVKLPSAQGAYARVLEKGYDNHETYNFQGGGYSMHFMVRDTGGGTHGASLKGEIPENEWAFLAGVYNGSEIKIYLNGQLSNTDPAGSFTPFNSSGEPLCIGGRPKPGGVDRLMNGMVDDVRVYNHGMSDDDIKEMFAWIGGDTSVAALPVPKHQSINISPYTILSWFPGKGATSHDVYLGTDETLVENATTASPEYKGNVTDPNYDPPGLLELGQRYYWRIDEQHVDQTAKGDVWQFAVDDGKASNPNPPDGLANTPVDAVLSWTAGNFATSHDVYFGTDEAAVANATPSTPDSLIYKGNQVETLFAPGTLEVGLTYYWRIDEIGDDDTFAKGDVWSFVTVGALHLQVDLALPRCSEAGIFTDPPVAGTLKEGWWPWVAGRWADMYSHDCVWEADGQAEGGIAGTGVHAMLSCGKEGQGGLHVKGMCRCGLAGDCCPTGEAQGDPIANSWYYAVDWAGPDLGDIALIFTDLPPGEYQLISYHNHWEPCSQSTRNCCDCICGMPPMPSVTVQGLPADPPEGYRGLCLKGDGAGVTAIENAYDVKVTNVYSDDQVATSVLRFETDGSEVLIIYEAPDWGYPDCARADREGGRGILNAFELILVEAAPCECLGDVSDTSGFGDPDGKVDIGDLNALLLAMIEAYPEGDPMGLYVLSRGSLPCGADCSDTTGFGDPDGKVDIGDLNALLSAMIAAYPEGDPTGIYQISCLGS